MEVNGNRNFQVTDILLNIRKSAERIGEGVLCRAHFQKKKKKVEYPFKKAEVQFSSYS